MSYSWTATRDAIQAALVSASGLGDAQIIAAHQDANQPELTYLSWTIGASREVGQDGISQTFDEDRDPGEEFEIAVAGIREVTLTVEAYTAATVSSATGDDALAVGERIRTSLRLPGIRAALAAVGVTPFDLSAPVIYVPPIVSAGFRGRAVATVRLYMPAPAASELTGYIGEIKATLTARGGGAGDRTINIDVTGPTG